MTETLKSEPAAGKSWLPVVALAWLIPGGGHFLLKRTSRGVILGVSVILIFLQSIRGTLVEADERWLALQLPKDKELCVLPMYGVQQVSLGK